ncbi:MAG TPA: PTS sugar transporter subunit IIA [Spirochaetota bacterium]|nr:PTS sugar transporter subunit IIA [Spirochaetota bacterium]
MLISEIFKVENIKLTIQSEDKEELFEEMVNFLVDAETLSNRDEILEGLWRREKKMTTGIAPNIAVPHTHIPNIEKTIGVIGVSQKGIEYDALDGNPVHLVMMLIGKDTEPEGHLKVLKNLAILMTNPNFYPSIMSSKTEKELHNTIVEFEDLTKYYCNGK